jgi:dTDP-4-dehydrorhamnose reductase
MPKRLPDSAAKPAMPNPTLRILLTGSNGQVGRALQQTLPPLGKVVALDRSALDLANRDAIRNAVRECRPQLIINAAAYTAVDRAETEPDLAMAVNGIAPGVLAEEAHRINAVLLHYSTDYVFDGTKTTPYLETDKPSPLNVYGKTKLAGEDAIRATGAAHYILRTSWVYAAEGANFLNTILRLANERPELRIVNDQTGAPTWAGAIADLTAQLLATGQRGENPSYGLYNLTASGAVTWFGFAQAILAEAQKTADRAMPRLTPITTAEYPLPARRPANSRLDTTRLNETFGIRPAPWQDMMAQCMRQKRPR